MEFKTPHNQLFYNNNTQNPNLMTKIIDFTITRFCNDMGFNKPYFYQFLPFSEKQAPKYFNPNDDTKKLDIESLLIILDNLDKQHQKLILDFLAQRYQGLFIFNEDTQSTNLSLEHLLLNITSTDGQLSKQFLEAIEDNKIDKNEQLQLKDIAYRLRSLLRIFESRINK